VALGRKRTPREYLGLVGRGFAMGSADVVPGVSGGTMAFILGIYEELILSIRSVARPAVLQPLFKLRIGQAWQAVNGNFLVAVFVGIVLAVLTLAQGLEWLLENQPVLLWSFFFGLVLASVFVVRKRIPQWKPLLLAMTGLGAVGAYLLVGLVPVQTPEDWWFLILSGALAICAMILPGISGAFILVLLGKYQFALAAVNNRDFLSIALIGMGAVIGLISFAQVLGWLFKRYHDLTVALLIGLMIGSLRKIWPWKEVLETMQDRHGALIPLVEQNILPAVTINGSINMEIFIALLLAAAGFALVLGLDRFANRNG
jgi:putative membrane protein